MCVKKISDIDIMTAGLGLYQAFFFGDFEFTKTPLYQELREIQNPNHDLFKSNSPSVLREYINDRLVWTINNFLCDWYKYSLNHEARQEGSAMTTSLMAITENILSEKENLVELLKFYGAIFVQNHPAYK